MVSGSFRVRLILREARSLKDKRQVVRSIMEKLKSGFNVAVAEVDDREAWQSVVLGIVTVGETAEDVKTTLDAIAGALRSHPIAQYASGETIVETVPF